MNGLWSHRPYGPDGERFYRFSRSERIAHWWNALTFFFLVATGTILFFRAPLGIAHATVLQLRRAHSFVGGAYFFGPLTIYLIGHPGAGLAWFVEAFKWTREEFVWLIGPLRRVVLPRRQSPVVGRFNAGQRINMLAQITGKAVMGITGVIIYYRIGALLPYAIHLLGFIALTFIAVGHMYMGLLHPTTRESVTGMITGWVRTGWLAHHHPGWVEKHRSRPRQGVAKPGNGQHTDRNEDR